MTRFVPLLFTLALAACALPPSADAPYTTIPAGARLVLTQPLTIPAGEVSTYLQYGRAVPFGAVNRYYPNCKFEVWELKQVPRTVEPDTFTVTRVVRDTWLVGSPAPWRVAALDVFAGFGFGDDSGGPTAVEMSTILYLESRQQPGVYRMTCSHWEDPRLPNHLTINEIRSALGDVIRLEGLGELGS